MGLFDTLTSNPQVNSTVGGIFSGYLNQVTTKLLPGGSLTPDAKANVARPSIQGQPSVAPQATPAIGGWKSWLQKPVIWIIGGVAVILIAWKLFAKRGK